MKKNILSVAFLILAFNVSFLNAQTIDPTVVVSRDFDVKMMEIRKPDLPTDVADSLQRFDISFDYSIFNRPYLDLYEFSPYQSAQLKEITPRKNPFVYARIGTQYPLLPSAELYLQAVSKGGFYASLYGRHNSFWGNVPSAQNDYEVASDRMKNIVGGNMKYAWNTGEVLFDANYNYDRYKFDYGVRSADHDNRELNLSMNLNSAYRDDDSIYYRLGVLYRHSEKYLTMQDTLPIVDTIGGGQLKENLLKVTGSVGTTFDVHRVYIDMDIEYASYSGTKDHTAGIVEFSPIYEYKKGKFFGKIGVKFGSIYGINTEDNTQEDDQPRDHESISSNIFPDVDARLELSPKTLWLHAVVGGGNELNAFSSLTNLCPLIGPKSQLNFASRPLDAKFSFETVIRSRIAFNAYSSFTVYRNKMIFTPVISGGEPYSIVPEYFNVNKLTFGLETFWKSKDVTTGGEFKYNRYSSPDSLSTTNLPKFTGHVYLRYNWRERIVAQVDCNYTSSVSGDKYGVYSVPAIWDLDVHVNFVLSKNLAVFCKGGNLLNKRNQYIPLYVEPGINFGGGICVNF